MTVGYLFTDIEGSTERWELSPARMAAAVARHDKIIDAAVAAHAGAIQDRAGDGVFAVFAEGNPIACALAIQRDVAREDWEEVGGFRVRIGVHVGTPTGSTLIDRAAVNRAARISASGWGGQTVVSAAAADAYPLPDRAMLDDLGVCYLKGIPEPLHLFGLRHAHLPEEKFPPLRSQFRSEGTIPLRAAPIFGRAHDIAAISEALVQTRLLTVVGPGGNGKTRLATELGKEWESSTPVLFVSLRGVVGSADLVSAIGESLRFPFRERVTQDAQLGEYFKDKRLLLILDNAEGLAGDAGFVATLVSSCPELAVLATSREPLRVSGEGLYRLGGVSDVGGDVSPALQLFTHAARGKEPGFDLSEKQLPTFQRLCARIGGSPLALRLMAQWVSYLSLEEILTRVETDLDFLGGAGSEEQHHRTLREVFDESWRRLDEGERIALGTLSVLEAPFDWKKAHAVFATPLSAFAALEQKGLIEPAFERSFSMHPLIRSYAREKLEAEPERANAVLASHRAYFLNFLCARMEAMSDCGQGRICDELQSQFADIRAAWLATLRANDVGAVTRASEHLCYFLNLRSMLRDGVALFDDGLVAGSATRLHLRAIRANFLFFQGEPAQARVLCDAILQAEHAPPLAIAHAKMVLAGICFAKGVLNDTDALYQEILRIRVAENDRVGVAFVTISLASLHVMFGDRAIAREYIKESFLISRQMGLTFGLVVAHMLAGEIALQEGRLDDAQANYASGLELESIANTAQYRAQLLRRAGYLALRMGRHEEADKYHSEALELFLDLGDQRAQAQAYIDLGEDSMALDNFGEARDRFLRGARLAEAFASVHLRNLALLGLARTELSLGNVGNAARIVRILSDTDLAQKDPAYAALVDALGARVTDDGPCALDEVLNEIAHDAETRPLML